ncbi:MAG: zinc ABC transporter substrate-binding protein [Planctomycetes bacterium]|nr:zinc ABC transporter substrate-binding protein [Planctomycetota bacterium]
MKLRWMLMLVLLCVAVIAAGCRRSAAPSSVAATNSMLECAARDLLGEAAPVLRLAEPGMCPGHFDIRPSQVAALRRCRVLLRFDFQRAIDGKLAGAIDEGLVIAEIRVPGGLCEPASYTAACRQTADALVGAALLDRTGADERLERIADRMEQRQVECRRRVEALAGMPVVASAHQEAFCRWLGLDVVATFSAADTAGVGQVDQAVRRGEAAGAKLVIANGPEGRKLADALAERLGTPVVVFGNFPALDRGHACFDDLLAANVAALVEATGR